MRDIRYKWNSGSTSVGISREVELPQFRVLGHRQRATVINLSTGNQPSPSGTSLTLTNYYNQPLLYLYDNSMSNLISDLICVSLSPNSPPDHPIKPPPYLFNLFSVYFIFLLNHQFYHIFFVILVKGSLTLKFLFEIKLSHLHIFQLNCLKGVLDKIPKATFRQPKS